MDLHTYLLNRPRGEASRLARMLGVPFALMSQWRTGHRPIPAGRCPDIEAATNGAVRCEELRPDVRWGVLRARRRGNPGAAQKALTGAQLKRRIRDLQRCADTLTKLAAQHPESSAAYLTHARALAGKAAHLMTAQNRKEAQ